MASFVSDLVAGVACSDTLPSHPQYFTSTLLTDCLYLDEDRPSVGFLLSAATEAEVVSVRVVKTPAASSGEGQKLSGARLSVELKITQRIRYATDEPGEGIHIADFKQPSVILPVTVPQNTSVGPHPAAISVEELLAQKRLKVTPYIEDVHIGIKDRRTLQSSLSLLVDAVPLTIGTGLQL